MLDVYASVKACSLYKFRFHAPIYTIFDPVMHRMNDLDLHLTYFSSSFLGRNAKSR